MTATVVPVFVDSWQHECCGTPFAVGDVVTWTLLFVPASEALPDDLLADLPLGPGEAAEANNGLSGFRVGGLVDAFVPSETPPPPVVRGVLMHESHGAVPDDLPGTTGKITRIRLVTQPFHLVGERTWALQAPLAQLADISRSPDTFTTQGDGPPPQWEQTGVLVDLAIG